MNNVTILRLDNFARGVCKIDGKITFVNNSLPREIVNIKIIKEYKNYNIANVISIEKKSIDRSVPLCKYYDICGGCQLMHLNYLKQLEYKKEKVKEIFNRICKIDINIKDIVYSSELNYRNKIKLHVNNNKIGLFIDKTNTIVNIDKCLLVENKINEIIERLNKYINNNKTNISEITIRINRLNEYLININGTLDKNIFINSFSDCKSIYLNNKNIYNSSYIEEKIYNHIFNIYPDNFYQVNYNIMDKLYEYVIDFFKNKKNCNVLDLYSGSSIMGILISKYVNKILSVEINKYSTIAANDLIKKEKINNIIVKCGKVKDFISLYKDYNYAIIDPPRSGIDIETINTLNSIELDKIIYISCNINTLTRDINLLKEKYDVVECKLFDMFPNTYHVETVSVLCRRN